MLTNIRVLVFLLLCIFIAPVFAASVFTVTSGDRANVGFNDPSPFTAVGGNNAATLGQARINALQFAANKLSIQLNSSVKINILAFFSALGGSNRGAVLAGAAATGYQRDFIGAPVANTLYHIAVAEKLAGREFNATATGGREFEVSIRINRDIDGNVALGATKWYYGFDENPRGDIDFVSVITHEIVHGIGFSTQMSSSSGRQNGASNDNYINNLEHHGATTAAYPAMRLDSQRAAGNRAAVYGSPGSPTFITATNLHWVGPALVSAANSNAGFQTVTGHAGMFSPSPVQSGSSVSHFSKLFSSPDQMMEPAYRGVNHNLGFAAQILEDVGWGKLNTNTKSTDLSVAIVNPNANPLGGTNELYSITVTNNGSQTATGILVSNFLPANSTFVSVTPANGATCDSTNVRTNRIVNCSLASLPASGSAVFNILVTVNSTGRNEFSANVLSLNPDTLMANNNAVNQTIQIVNTPVAPVLSNISDQSIVAGQTVNFTLSATDSNGTTPIIRLASRSPQGSTFNENRNGTASFSWPTRQADIGVVMLDFTAADGDPISTLEDTVSVKITVVAAPAVNPIPTPLPNTPVTQNPVGTGGEPTRSNNEVPAGGCTLTRTAKFDPILPGLLLLFSLLYLWSKKRKVILKTLS